MCADVIGLCVRGFEFWGFDFAFDLGTLVVWLLWLAGCFRDFLFFWFECGFGLLGRIWLMVWWISLVFACMLLICVSGVCLLIWGLLVVVWWLVGLRLCVFRLCIGYLFCLMVICDLLINSVVGHSLSMV